MNSPTPIYSVNLQWLTVGHRAQYRTVSKTVEIAAPDIVTASQLALNALPKNLIHPAVSMIWQKTDWQMIAGVRRLVHVFTDGLRLWAGKEFVRIAA
jgi:hypothetical protein